MSSSKPSVFIGSSSEGYQIAEVAFGHLSDSTRPFLWKHGLFRPSQYPQEALDVALRQHDFAVIVGTPDDLLTKRDTTAATIRDNLIYEFGLFTGVLGRNRTFLLVPSKTPLALPSDWVGLSYVRYDEERFILSSPDALAALQQGCFELRNIILSTWERITAERLAAERRAMEHRQYKALNRLFQVVVELRDLLILLPGQVLDALQDREEFESAKGKAAESVDRLAALFSEDAEVCNLTPAFQELVGATRTSILSFPYPEEVLVSTSEVQQTLLKQGFLAIEQLIQHQNPLAQLSNTVESELERRCSSLGQRYMDWWSATKRRLQRLTQTLQDAVSKSMFVLGGHLLADPHLSTRGTSGRPALYR